MNIDTLKALQTRLRNSSGADRGLDKAITDALHWSFPGWLSFGEHKAKHGHDVVWVAHSNWINDGVTSGAQLPPWTASLDACVALMREKLPGYWWCAGADAAGNCVASIRKDGASPEIETSGSSASHALLLAIISALIAQLEATEGVA